MTAKERHRPPSIRSRRVADEIRACVASLVTTRLADPRLAGVCVTEVDVTPDLRLATVYFRLLPTTTANAEIAVEALEHARGVFRRELGQQLRLRSVPDLRFRPDPTADHSAHIERILAEIQAERPPSDDEDDADPDRSIDDGDE